ncbi:MAG: response regulator [Lentisphaerae bacterium]|nr:MAG: response regulator [Lentisphaerota bacterium]
MNSPLPNPHLLVVEDNPALRQMIREICDFKAIPVFLFEQAEPALEFLDDHPECRRMLIDLDLPGISGIEFCQRVRPEFPDATIVAMTGFTSQWDKAACLQAGFDQLCQKPLQFDRVFRALALPVDE